MLFPFQQEDAEALSRSDRRYLGNEPGLGKTRTVLEAARLAGVKALHVLCPAAVVPHWKREHAKLEEPYELVVESYQRFVLSSPARVAFGLKTPYLALACDEAHFLKHTDSQRTEHVLGPAGVARRFTQVWPMSGTPMPRNPLEMYPALWSLWPNRLLEFGIKTRHDYLSRYCLWRPTEWGIKVYGAKNVDELQELLKPVLIRRLYRDVAPDLPELRWGTVTIAVPSLAGLPDLDPRTKAAIEAGELPPMSPNLAEYRHAVGDLKAIIAAELVTDELRDPDAKRVVYYYHESVGDLMARYFLKAGVNIRRIDGRVSQRLREEIKQDFTTNKDTRVLLAQIGCVGTGFDGLQYATHEGVIVEPSWGSDENVQAGRRLCRIGSTRPALVRFLALAGTIDEAIVRNHEREVKMVTEVVG